MAVIILPLYKGREYFFLFDEWNRAKITVFFPKVLLTKLRKQQVLAHENEYVWLGRWMMRQGVPKLFTQIASIFPTLKAILLEGFIESSS